ncbi:MAG: PTS fructose transporter subunit IIA [Gemmatimonadetes bacterium]|nr:MAG: PTS fructose transporter subunit IIA [Gemmatimonadota bacterium]
MSDLRGIIVTHAAVAQALVTAVAAITGVQDALTGVSNEGCGTEELSERLRQAIGDGPAVLFVDLPGGSCFTSSVRYAKQHAEIAVVTGVNLAMLLDFVFHRDIPPAEAARRAVDAGAKAIRITGAA